MLSRVYVFMPGLLEYLPQSAFMPFLKAKSLAASVRAAYPHLSVIVLPY